VRRRLGLFFACAAIALHALWPLIAQAKPHSVALVPLCTVGGETHYAEVPLGRTPAEEQSSSHFEHCSLCTLGGERAIVQSPGVAVFGQDFSFQAFSENETPFDTRSISSVRSRAPPVSALVDRLTDESEGQVEEASALRDRGARAGDAHSGRGILRKRLLRA